MAQMSGVKLLNLAAADNVAAPAIPPKTTNPNPNTCTLLQ